MKRALLITAAFLAATPALAQGFPPAPPIAQPKPFRVPASETFALPNGMMVTLIPTGIAPKTVVSLRIRAGNATEGAQTWLADLTGEMLKEGAAGRSSADIATAAAGMGGSIAVGVGN
ncbi:MAG: insulinase family protein, partial [Sphingomonadales bacterium]